MDIVGGVLLEDGTEAVSYTHLDVYKRQPEHLPHGRTQEGDHHLTSTNLGTPSISARDVPMEPPGSTASSANWEPGSDASEWPG